nr:alpha/beta hydrolase-fold protein [Ancylobacter crimeensis]
MTGAEGGPGWRIFVAVPDTPPPEAGYPSLLMLDANAGFASFAETARRAGVRPRATGIGPVLIVGVGYPTEAPHDRERRRFDFTAGPAREAAPPGREVGPTGGSAAFLAFLLDRLRPAIAARWRLDPARAALFGHSLGGAFVLEAFARAPRAFSHHIAVSPSIWWDEPHLLAGLAARDRTAPARLALMIGEYEEALAPWQQGRAGSAEIAERRARRAMVTTLHRFAQAARRELGPQARIVSEVLAGEDHASVLAPAMSRALRFLSAD